MATTVEITLADDGSLTVGIAEQPSADLDDSQQVASVDQALAMAKHLLANPPPDTDNEAGEGADADDSQGGGATQGAQASGSPGGADGSGGAGGMASSGGGAGGAAPSAADMWNQMAQQQGPAH